MNGKMLFLRLFHYIEVGLVSASIQLLNEWKCVISLTPFEKKFVLVLYIVPSSEMILVIIILINGSYFLADTVLEELTFGWSRRMEDLVLRQQLAMRLQAAIFAVILT